jgi:hypothetical protein
MVAANAGVYTFPDRGLPWPQGIRNAHSHLDLAAAFGRPLTLLLGERDVDPEHPGLNVSAKAQAQGPHRFARGSNFFQTSARCAAAMQVPFHWRCYVSPDLHHANADALRAALAVLFPFVAERQRYPPVPVSVPRSLALLPGRLWAWPPKPKAEERPTTDSSDDEGEGSGPGSRR